MNCRLEEWWEALEDKELRFSRSKTEYYEHNFERRQVMSLRMDEVSKIEIFMYLGSILQMNDSFEECMKHRFKR